MLIRADFETESEEMLRANPPVELTPDLWVGFSTLIDVESVY